MKTEAAYFDAQAAVPVDQEVLDAMAPFFTERFGNPSSLHTIGRDARTAVEEARASAARLIGAQDKEIIFTSCATESIGIALDGMLSGKTGRVITTPLEHPSVLLTLKRYAKQGIDVTELPVSQEGIVDVNALRESLGAGALLVAIQHANQEIGVVQDIPLIGRICAEAGVPLLVDATASVGKLPVNVKEMGASLLAFSGSDLYGPKGTGVLYAKLGLPLERVRRGGGQERDLRPGTENVPGIAGLGKACQLASARMEEDTAQMLALRDQLIDGVLSRIPKSHLNGSRERRLPSNAHFRFDYIEGESLILTLDMVGIHAATGSACSSRTLEASKVLLSLGLEQEQAHGSLELTLSRLTTKEEVKYLLDELPGVVKRLRAMSPLYVE